MTMIDLIHKDYEGKYFEIKAKREQAKKVRYRSKHTIYFQIMNAMGLRDASVTRIVYCTFCSYQQTKFHLVRLAELGLVSYNAEENMHRLTARGNYFVQIYRVMAHALGEDIEE